jgi:hypothetical protein
MFTEQVLKHLSYKCGCPLDIRESLGIVNGICPTHSDGVLLFDGVPLKAAKSFFKKKWQAIKDRLKK